jgi:hypothetical protein
MTRHGHAPNGVFKRSIVPKGAMKNGDFRKSLGLEGRLCLVQQAELSGPGGGFRAVADPQLGTNIGGVLFRRLW